MAAGPIQNRFDMPALDLIEARVPPDERGGAARAVPTRSGRNIAGFRSPGMELETSRPYGRQARRPLLSSGSPGRFVAAATPSLLDQYLA